MSTCVSGEFGGRLPIVFNFPCRDSFHFRGMEEYLPRSAEG
jgi:hypothetical protein